MKPKEPIFDAKIIEQKGIHVLEWAPGGKAAMGRWLQTFKPETRVEIIIRKRVKKRSNDQNAYYWGVVIPILANHFGHDNPEDMHTDLKELFNPVESKVSPGKKIGGSTAKMTTVEFMSADDSYVERICRWAAIEHGIYIPPPSKNND